MAPGRKHASFQLRSQSDNGVIIELTPLSVCGCISLRLTPSGAALTSFLMLASAVHQLGCKGGARGSPWPSAHASCSPDVCACGIFMVRLVSVAFLIWGVKLAFLHCVVLMEGKVGAAVVWIVLRELRGTSAPAPTHPLPPLPPGRARVCLFCAAYTCEWGPGIGNFTFSLQETLKQLKVVPLVSIFNSAGAQVKLTFFGTFLHN